MRAITIQQPWASLVIDGPKRIENRLRRTHIRDWVLVHAGASWSAARDLRVFEFCRHNGLLTEDVSAVLRSSPQLGGIIGAMHIADCKSDADQLGGYPVNSPWFIGPYAWVIDRVVKLPFIPCKGMQGWFNVELPPEIKALIPKP